MEKVSIIGLDLAKHVFQAHGADSAGRKLFSRKLSRTQVLGFFAEQPRCVVAMEACSTSHYWARAIAKIGHEVKLIPPQYVKPFVKRQKNDAMDAEAICEAAMRPTMRFVAIKSEEKHADCMLFRARDLLVRQRSQLVHAMRGHFAEFGYIAAAGISCINRFREWLSEATSVIPSIALDILRLLLKSIDDLSAQLVELDRKIADRAKSDDLTQRLMTVPGIGKITAMAISALAPDAATFASGRDFAAWIGLTRRQHSSGGKELLGKISKKGNQTLRRLLIICASSRVKSAVRHGKSDSEWLRGMLARKPRMLVITALANKLARIVWALSARGGVYRAPAMAA